MKTTNAMRQLSKAKVAYQITEYAYQEDDLSGVHAAEALGLPAGQVFKTLVGTGDKTGVCVFCIPSDAELDLKAAAIHTGNKRVELLPLKELLPVTGYIRGGCSPIGMKKRYLTLVDVSAADWPEIAISAGVRGQQILLAPDVLLDFLGSKTAPLVRKG